MSRKSKNSVVTVGKIGGIIVAIAMVIGLICVGISIENGVISNTQTSAEWGNITGTLSEQTDLKNVLDTKADQENVYTKQEINNLMSSIVVATVYDYGDE